MHVVEVSTNGVAVGTIRFRGIVPTAEKRSEKRRYQCSPKECVPRSIAKKIADRISEGLGAGHEDVFAWRT